MATHPTASDLLTAAEAATALGVKPATLYAYVARGLLQSQPGEGRARRYRRDDLEKLRTAHPARGSVHPALTWGEPVLETAISAIGPEGPRYRGRAAVALAREDVPFEAVAELLWTGTPPDPAPTWPAPDPGLPAGLLGALVPAGTPPMAALAALVPTLGARDPGRYHAAPAAVLTRARALIPRMAAGLALGIEPDRVRAVIGGRSVAAIAAAALGARGGRVGVRAVNRALVLCADHELNASTFAARVAASAGADLYACFGAALGALAGPKHGGACDRVEALVAEAGEPAKAARAVHDRARRGEPVPGFSHPLYPDGDPRCAPLLSAARALRPDNRVVLTLGAIADAMAAAFGAKPTMDVGLVALAGALGLPPGSAAGLFALGRTAGWVAHILEQAATGVMLRPRARYAGAP